MTDDLSRRAGLGGTVVRHNSFDGAELRASDGGNSLTFTGYASVFNRSYSVSDDYGPFNESVAPGAFRDSLASGADVPFKINHEGMTLARTKSGTMTLSEDSNGLHVEARLDPGNPQVQALRSAMDRQDIDEMSFAFRCTAEDWSNDWMHRTVTGADIHKGDVSVVNYGANPFTSGASLHSAADFMRAMRAIQESEGFSPEELDEIKAGLISLAIEPEDSADAAEAERALYGYRARLLDLSPAQPVLP